MSFKIQLKSF